MIKIPFINRNKVFRDTHEKPWGGVYARRLWKKFLLAVLLLLLLSAWGHYEIYRYFTRPVVFSQKSINKEVTNLDKEGLDKAVADIKDKEARFSEYLSQKVQIADPAK